MPSLTPFSGAFQALPVGEERPTHPCAPFSDSWTQEQGKKQPGPGQEVAEEDHRRHWEGMVVPSGQRLPPLQLWPTQPLWASAFPSACWDLLILWRWWPLRGKQGRLAKSSAYLWFPPLIPGAFAQSCPRANSYRRHCSGQSGSETPCIIYTGSHITTISSPVNSPSKEVPALSIHQFLQVGILFFFFPHSGPWAWMASYELQTLNSFKWTLTLPALSSVASASPVFLESNFVQLLLQKQ